MQHTTKASNHSFPPPHPPLQTILARNHSTGEIFQARTQASDYKRFPETLSRVRQISRPLLLPQRLRPEIPQNSCNSTLLPEQKAFPCSATHPLSTTPQPSRLRCETPSKLPPCNAAEKQGISRYAGGVRHSPELHRSLASLELTAKTRLQLTSPLIGYMKKSTGFREKSLEKAFPNPVTKVAFRTQTGLLQSRPKPHNQDNFLVISDFDSTKYQKLLGVFDGHGRD
jgi:hypothetical protein